MAYQKTNLGQPGEFDFVEDVYGKPDQWAELNATKSKLGFLWDGFKKYSKKLVLDPLANIFGDRAKEVVDTSIDILVKRGQQAVIKKIEDRTDLSPEEKDQLIVAYASDETVKMEQQANGGGALIPIVIAALSIGVLFGGRK